MTENQGCTARWYDGKHVHDTINAPNIKRLKKKVARRWLRPSHDLMVHHGVISEVPIGTPFHSLAKTICDNHPAGMEIVIWEQGIHTESY